MRDVAAFVGRLLDFVTQWVFVAVLLVVCGVAEWRLAPVAFWTEGLGAGVFVIVVLTLAGLAAVSLCRPRRLP